MANDENKIILEFPATNVEIKFGETITFDNISGFLNSDRVTYNGESLTEEIAHLENDKADETYVDTELAKKADKTDTYTKSQVDNALNNKMNKANPTGTGRIAVGQGVVASGTNSQAFGTSSTASGLFSHAEGLLTTASGESSHAEGYLTTASGQSSHAEGYQTIASGRFQHVSGSYNVVDNNNTYVEIIGNGGNSYSRSNARTLDWSGNETLMGDLTFNGNKSLTSEISRLDGRIDNLPAPMIFKGTLGVGGTIQSLPTASASNEGFTYKVITDGTYAGQTAKVGDVFTSNGFEWVLIPAGDEDNDTWRAIKINGVEKLGNGISSGAVDFEDTANVKFEFDANGNKVRARLNGIYTESEVDDLLDDKADADNTYTKEQSDEKYATKTELSNKADVSAIPTKTSQLQNDSGFTQIDDSEASASKTYSSNKIDNLLNAKASTAEMNTALALKADKSAVDSEVAELQKGDSILVEKGYFTDAQKALDRTISYDTVKYYADKGVLVGNDVRSASGTASVGINYRDFGLDSSNAIIDINEYPYLCYMLESDVPSNVAITLTIWYYNSSMAQYTETTTITTRDKLVFFNLKEFGETMHKSRYYKYAFVVACSSASYSFTTASLKFSMFGFFTKAKVENYNLNAKVGNLLANVSDVQSTLAIGIIEPQKTSFFEGANYFDVNTAKLFTDRYVYSDGKIAVSGSVANTLVIPVKPNTDYYLYIPNNNEGRIAENSTPDFILGNTYSLVYSAGYVPTGAYHFTTGANGNYVAVYFRSGSYDYDGNKNSIILNVGKFYNGENPFVPYDYLPWDISNVFKDTQILIFGDSITDCCSITIDGNNRTSAYSWRNPSLSYTDEHGNTIGLSKWAKIINESQPIKEVRNYALSGASYKTATRTAGNERQNLQYQIDVAINDLDNPNNVFAVDHFNPDIVIFALGTNDGNPNDNYTTAMSKTVLKSDGYSIDVDATIANLDDTKFCEAVRKAFMRVEKAFPTAQRYCVIPIQRADEETPANLNLYLSQMAERYGCVIINGYANCGITRDFNNRQALGTLLIDTLHPNEKGQNMMARMIISAIKSSYIPFGLGFNQ